MSKWDGKFDGTYATSRYAGKSLEDQIMDAGCGKFYRETSDGGLMVEKPGRIDVWGRGSGKGDYKHGYYNGFNDYGMAPDDRH